jgi:putative transposase
MMDGEPVYDYRKMTPDQRAEVVAERMARGYPSHAPPRSVGENTYMLSAACFEHRAVMLTGDRLGEFADALLAGVAEKVGGTVHAWVVLPNHYHLVASVDMQAYRSWVGRLHNGKATQWNREDATPGRKVWFRFSDRQIRSERHYYASVNYIHGNPVKHGYVEDARSWPWSSLHEYLAQFGAKTLREWWREYPVKDYGRGWDD